MRISDWSSDVCSSDLHGVEHFPFNTGQGKNREIHDHDDQLTENQWAARILCRCKHFMHPFGTCADTSMVLLCMSQAPDSVFDTQHRSVNIAATVQRAETHQFVAAYVTIGRESGKERVLYDVHISRYALT